MRTLLRSTPFLGLAIFLVWSWPGRVSAQDDQTQHAPAAGEHAAPTGEHGEAVHGDEHDSPSLFAGDLGNALWSLIIFVILLAVLGKFAWPAILQALQKREEFIRESLEQAQRDREAAEARLKEYEAKLHAARSEATAIVEEGRRDGDALKRKIEETARTESESMVQRAKRDIGLARDTAVKELYDKSADLAVQIAGKLIRKEVDAKQHQQLIAEAIESMKTGGGASRN